MFGDKNEREIIGLLLNIAQQLVKANTLSNGQLKVLNEILAALQAQSAGKPIALKFTLGKAVEK